MKMKLLTPRLTGLALAAMMLFSFQAVSFAGAGCGKTCGSTCGSAKVGADLGVGCSGHATATATTDGATTEKKAACPHAGAGHAVGAGAAGNPHAAMAMEALNYVNTAEKLYTCPMHAEVVTADGDKLCPSCNMELRPMSAKEMKKLRASEPKGCPMCALVLPGDAEQTTCPTCEMKLMPVPPMPQTGRTPAGM
ncbi:MAG: hypothetical protein ISR91_00215 [Candidatus Delongbacteria bacterium]|nr:hypothetical protein [Candidatus Delongbacteria bacterium]